MCHYYGFIFPKKKHILILVRGFLIYLASSCIQIGFLTEYLDDLLMQFIDDHKSHIVSKYWEVSYRNNGPIVILTFQSSIPEYNAFDDYKVINAFDMDLA